MNSALACPSNYNLAIQDNGIGFTDANFDRFSRLLKVDSSNHKGLGRLIYLAYFGEVLVESFYAGEKREFSFNHQFDGNTCVTDQLGKTGSNLHFKQYLKDKIYRYDYLIPDKIKRSLLDNFFPLLFQKKQDHSKLSIDISLDVLKRQIQQHIEANDG